MPTVYHRDDNGAPSYAFSTSSSSPAHFSALKTILKACLVSGYGSKPAAGWTLVAEGDQYLVLRNGTHSGYVCLTAIHPSCIEVWLAETFTGVVNNVMTGAGLKSGTAAGNTPPQRVQIGAVAHSSATSSWYVMADSKSFVFQGSGSYSELSGNQNTGNHPLYVGEDSEGWFIAVGGSNVTTTGPNSAFDSTGFTTLRDPSTGLLVDTGAIAVVTPELTQSTAALATIVNLSDLSVCTVRWGTAQKQAGRLRGQGLSPAISQRSISAAAQCLGYVGALGSRELNTPLEMGDSQIWFLGVNNYNSPTRLVTNNPEFW